MSWLTGDQFLIWMNIFNFVLFCFVFFAEVVMTMKRREVMDQWALLLLCGHGSIFTDQLFGRGRHVDQILLWAQLGSCQLSLKSRVMHKLSQVSREKNAASVRSVSNIINDTCNNKTLLKTINSYSQRPVGDSGWGRSLLQQPATASASLQELQRLVNINVIFHPWRKNCSPEVAAVLRPRVSSLAPASLNL